ncbi:MAG: TolC family protein [Prevotellaceae bacterium]|nr:TolC family protein [Prevotellaceae bacterium]
MNIEITGAKVIKIIDTRFLLIFSICANLCVHLYKFLKFIMKNIHLLAMLAGGLLAPVCLPAQAAWTLEQCIHYGLENNIQIKQQALTAGQSANLWQQSKLDFLPSLSARASYNMSWGRSVDLQNLQIIENRLTQSFGPSINASVSLFEGLQKVNTMKRYRADYRAAVEEAEQMRNTVALNITRAFLQVLLAKEVLATAEKSRESILRQHELTRQLVAAGSQPYSTLLEIEAQLASEEVQFITARNNVDLAYLSLRQLINLHAAGSFEIVAPVIDVEVVQRQEVVSSLYASAVRLPQIKRSEFRMESARHALAIAKGRYWPTISLTASYGSYFTEPNGDNVDFAQQLRNNRSPSLNFGLNIPLFQNWSIVTGARNARLSLRMAELELDSGRQELYKEIQQALADASAAYSRYQASEQTVAAMQEAFRYMQEKFDVGLVNTTDYTIAKNNLFKAESDRLQAKYQYVFQTKIIDFYKGMPLTL